MASKGIGQRFPTGAILLIIAQVMTFYSRLISYISMGAEINFLFLFEIAAYIAFAITVLTRKRGVGMLICTILITLFFFEGFTLNTDYGIFNFLVSLTNLVTMLSLCVFAVANLGVGFFEKLQKVFVKLFRICFFVGLVALVIGDMRALTLYDGSFTIVIALMVSIFHKIALYMVGLWMADGSRSKPVRKNAYLTDAEPWNLKKV